MAVKEQNKMAEAVNKETKTPIHFSMKMPEWFAEVDEENRKRIIDQIMNGKGKVRKLTRKELMSLAKE
jgi:hypothetical protein